MKSKLFRAIIRVIFLVLVITSCKETYLVPDLEGSLVGYVLTFDEFSGLLQNHSDVIVTVHGQYHVAQTRTDAGGRFEFRKLPAGTYELQLEKPGYGTMIQPGIQHLGGKPTILGLTFSGSTWGAYYLFQVPTTEIDYLTLQNDTLLGNFKFTGEQPYSMVLMLYLSDESGFMPSEAKWIVTRYLSVNNGTFKGIMDVDRLPFGPGVNVYYRAAVVVGRDLYFGFNTIGILDDETYVDYYTGRIIHPSLGDVSDQYTFIMPE